MQTRHDLSLYEYAASVDSLPRWATGKRTKRQRLLAPATNTGIGAGRDKQTLQMSFHYNLPEVSSASTPSIEGNCDEDFQKFLAVFADQAADDSHTTSMRAEYEERNIVDGSQHVNYEIANPASQSTLALFSAVPVDVLRLHPASAKSTLNYLDDTSNSSGRKRRYRSQQQETAIMNWLAHQGYMQEAPPIPVNRHLTARARCRQDLQESAVFKTANIFNKAWTRLVAAKKISNFEKFRCNLSRQREIKIIDWLKNQGHTPEALPTVPVGNRSVKAECRIALKTDPLFTNEQIFNAAWARLAHNKKISSPVQITAYTYALSR
ncbi:MAG: hypothetical protein V4695_08665 [Pseudomonadota bacterium]